MFSIIIFITLVFFLLFFLVIYKNRNQTTKIWQKAIISSKPDYTKVEHKWGIFNAKGLYYCNVFFFSFYFLINSVFWLVLQKVDRWLVQYTIVRMQEMWNFSTCFLLSTKKKFEMQIHY